MVGAHAALAIVAALAHRDRSGEGQLVEVALLEVATAVTAEQVIRYAIDGTLFDRRGTGGVYRALGDDEWLSVDIGSDPMDRRGTRRVGARRVPRPTPSPSSRLPVSGRRDGARVRDARRPPTAGARLLRTARPPGRGPARVPDLAVRMSAGPARFWSGPAPTLGQHTEDVLRGELGVSDAELERLRNEHVIGTTPHFG
jgi:crotonobetainyl-CoA:carnitine CoA-transferase CaiB-like acyl-CoA transferase